MIRQLTDLLGVNEFSVKIQRNWKVDVIIQSTKVTSERLLEFEPDEHGNNVQAIGVNMSYLNYYTLEDVELFHKIDKIVRDYYHNNGLPLRYLNILVAEDMNALF